MVLDDIDAIIYREKLNLIAEAEDTLKDEVKENDKIKFPKYIIIRDHDS